MDWNIASHIQHGRNRWWQKVWWRTCCDASCQMQWVQSQTIDAANVQILGDRRHRIYAYILYKYYIYATKERFEVNETVKSRADEWIRCKPFKPCFYISTQQPNVPNKYLHKYLQTSIDKVACSIYSNTLRQFYHWCFTVKYPRVLDNSYFVATRMSDDCSLVWL